MTQIALPLAVAPTYEYRAQTALGVVYVANSEQLQDCPAWKLAFSHQRKDHRYYEIVEQTIEPAFDHRYFILEDLDGDIRAVQPFFLLDQDLLAGSGPTAKALAARLRRLLPRALTIRTLMLGCAAGEGHLCHESAEAAEWIGQCLHDALKPYARSIRARMIVLKEFPALYRAPLSRFSNNGYTRVPSLPMTRLNIDYSSFDDYMTRALSKVTRKGLRRKFRDAEHGAPIQMQVVENIAPYVDEIYPLYLQVYQRSHLQFEKLTPAYLRELGRRMPDRARCFIWRREGKAIAFSLCLIHGDAIYDEYLGLDYAVAMDLHLYFWTFRDIVTWAMTHGCKWYISSALNYDPKLHLKSNLAPLDLYVAHTFGPFNAILRRVLPWLEPTRNDPILKQFANFADLWGDP